MFNNVERKIKKIAKIFFIVGIVLSAIFLLVLLAMGFEEEEFIYIFIAFVGAGVLFLLFWLGSIFIYAQGESLEALKSIDRKTSVKGQESVETSRPQYHHVEVSSDEIY